MKLSGRLFNQMTCLGVALATACTLGVAQAQTTKDGSGRVLAIDGSATYSVDGGAWVPLEVGAMLKPGSSIATAADSTVDVHLGINGPTVRVAPDSTVGFDKLTYTDTGADAVIETQINLQKGTAMGSVRKMAAASRYEIKTPAGVAGIRGTDYAINDQLQLFILNGLAHVAFILENGDILSDSVSSGEVFGPPGTKRPITRAEFDMYSQQIAALNTSGDSVDLPPGFGEPVEWNFPRIGVEDPNSPTGEL